MIKRFVHLNLHTEFSISDGLIQINPLIHNIVKKGMNAVAITDFCNLFATIKVFKSAINLGIKPIFGAEIPYYNDRFSHDITTLILLCRNNIGYNNLLYLISTAYQNRKKRNKLIIDHELISKYSNGLLALSGGIFGIIGKKLLSGNTIEACNIAKLFAEIFKNNFYLEIQRIGNIEEKIYNNSVIMLSKTLKLPLVATNNVRFLEKDDFEAHTARVCIQSGCTLSDNNSFHYSKEQYLRSSQDMISLFKDIPQSIENTIEIAKKCTLWFNFNKNLLPNFPIIKNSSSHYLSHLANTGLNNYLKKINSSLYDIKKLKNIYYKRLNKEINIIVSMGFTGYFLIVADFIKWAKKNNIPVGPGRGSGSGSLVSYVLGITNIDPIKYKLLFERFLNPERISMPDFDIDFCIEGRDRVIEYVIKKYGKENVSQIITFGTMTAKSVIRDVGRILNYPYNFVDKIAKLIPFELGITLQKALSIKHELKYKYQKDEEVRQLIDLAMKLEGTIRNVGTHAGGLIIAPSNLVNFTAIYCEKDSEQRISQFDKDDIEYIGLTKFDFLGLKTLTIIKWAIYAINKQRPNQDYIDINNIPLNDKKTFNLLNCCKTTAVFQLESYGIRELVYRLRPDCFDDIVALIALYRPGPLQSGMVDDFIDRKHGKQKIEYIHPDLKPILKSTYGIILYQEQVMQVAQVIANYTLGSADILRRAIGKKNSVEMKKQRNVFISGAKKNRIDVNIANVIFDLIEKFAGYGFNKSHSVAYAMIAYQTAWLKSNYSSEFMASVMSADMNDTKKILILIRECKILNIKILPPNINKSKYYFIAIDKYSILYGLGAIKGLGKSIIDHIVNECIKNGLYTSIFNFCDRIDLDKINKKSIEILIKSGTMDCWNIDRKILIHSLEYIIQISEKNNKDKKIGQINLFSIMPNDINKIIHTSNHCTDLEKLDMEKEVLGFYLTGHPVKYYINKFKNNSSTIVELYSYNEKTNICVFGLVNSIKNIITKNRKKILILNIDDSTSNVDIIVYDNIQNNIKINIKIGTILQINGIIIFDNYKTKYNRKIKIIAHKLNICNI